MKIFFIALIAVIDCLNIRLPSGRFTLKISYTAVNNFYLKYGNLIFNFTQTSVLLNKKNFSIKKLASYSFMSTSRIWITANLINPHRIEDNYIKIGHDFVLLNNTLYDFRPNDSHTLKIIRSLSSIEIDPFIDLDEYSVANFCLIKDPSFKIYSQYRQKIDPLEVPTSKYSLPRQLKSVYEVVKNRSPELSKLELDAVQFSFERSGCFLNEEQMAVVRFDVADHNDNPFVAEIYAKKARTNILENVDMFGVYKVLDGSMQVDFYNSANSSNVVKTRIINSDEMAWFSPNFYPIFRIKNLDSSRPLIITKSLKTQNFTNGLKIDSIGTIEYQQFKKIILKEFLSQTCESKISNCCPNQGPICGWKLIKNNCTRKIHPNALYFCHRKKNRITLAENCDEVCHQDQDEATCGKKFKARSMIGGSVLNFDQESNNVWMYGLIQDMDKNSLFIIRLFDGNDCNFSHNFRKLSLLSQLGDFSVFSHVNGTVYVNLRVNVSVINLLKDGQRSILDKIVVVEDKSGKEIKCGVVQTIDTFLRTSNAPKSVKKTDGSDGKKVLYAKWEDRKAKRKFLSYNDGSKWTEYNGDKIFAEFKFVRFDKDGVVIHDDQRGFYVKITNKLVKWGSKISNINWKFGNGKWIMKPHKLD